MNRERLLTRVGGRLRQSTRLVVECEREREREYVGARNAAAPVRVSTWLTTA